MPIGVGNRSCCGRASGSYTPNAPGPGSWTAPQGVYQVYIQAWGSGGNSFGVNNLAQTAGGGGGFSQGYINVTPGVTYSFTVDIAGDGMSTTFTGDSQTITANSGQTATVQDLPTSGGTGSTANGGDGAIPVLGTVGAGGGGAGGPGGNGDDGNFGYLSAGGTGGLGSTPGGNGGNGGNFRQIGNPGGFPGGGAGGCGLGASVIRPTVVYGGDGELIIRWG
jgi:hypothetical protein